MKKVLSATAVAIFSMMFAAGAVAAEWAPPGPIKLLIAFRAGGGADTQARLIAEELEARTGWKFIPEQVTGKGGVNMLKTLSGLPNDGTAIGMAVTESVGYNLVAAKAGLTADDFTGLTTTAGFQLGIVAQTKLGYKNMNEVITAAKGGKQFRFGVMSPRLADLAYLLERANDVQFNVVSYKGGKAVLDAINAGDVDMGFVAGVQAKGVKAGDLVELASALSVPLKMTPSAPTLADLGVKFNADGHFVFVAPKGLSAQAKQALGEAIAAVANDPQAKVAGIINRAFGGPETIKGPELDKRLADGYANANELMKAVAAQ